MRNNKLPPNERNLFNKIRSIGKTRRDIWQTTSPAPLLFLPPWARWWWGLPTIGLVLLFFIRIFYDIFHGDLTVQEIFFPAYGNAEQEDNLETIKQFSWEFTLSMIFVLLVAGKFLGERWDDGDYIRAHRDLITPLPKHAQPNLDTIKETPHTYMIEFIHLSEWLRNYYVEYLFLKSNQWTTAKRQEYWNAVMATILSVAEYMEENKIIATLQSIPQENDPWHFNPEYQGEGNKRAILLKKMIALLPKFVKAIKKEMVGIYLDQKNGYRAVPQANAIPPVARFGPDRATALSQMVTDAYLNQPLHRNLLRHLIQAFFSYKWVDGKNNIRTKYNTEAPMSPELELFVASVLNQDVITLQALPPPQQILIFRLLLEGNSQDKEVATVQQKMAYTLFWHAKFKIDNRLRVLSTLVDTIHPPVARTILYQLATIEKNLFVRLLQVNPVLSAKIFAVMMHFDYRDLPEEPMPSPPSHTLTRQDTCYADNALDLLTAPIATLNAGEVKGKEKVIESETTPLLHTESQRKITTYQSQQEWQQSLDQAYDGDPIAVFTQSLFWGHEFSFLHREVETLLQAMLRLPIEDTAHFFALTILDKKFLSYTNIGATIASNEPRLKSLIIVLNNVYKPQKIKQEKRFHFAATLLMSLYQNYQSTLATARFPYCLWNSSRQRINQYPVNLVNVLAAIGIQEVAQVEKAFSADDGLLRKIFQQLFLNATMMKSIQRTVIGHLRTLQPRDNVNPYSPIPGPPGSPKNS